MQKRLNAKKELYWYSLVHDCNQAGDQTRENPIMCRKPRVSVRRLSYSHHTMTARSWACNISSPVDHHAHWALNIVIILSHYLRATFPYGLFLDPAFCLFQSPRRLDGQYRSEFSFLKFRHIFSYFWWVFHVRSLAPMYSFGLAKPLATITSFGSMKMKSSSIKIQGWPCIYLVSLWWGLYKLSVW